MAQANDSFKRSRPASPVSTRRAPRRIFSRAIGVLLHGKYVLVQALQLSEGGMLFESKTPFAVKDIVVISIVIPGGHCIVTRAEIIYMKDAVRGMPVEYGVKFEPLTLPLRRLIRNYVSAKTQAEAEAETQD